MTVLGAAIAARIAAEGPLRVDRYIDLCLNHPEHGYYRRRDPLGTGGDFVTAPEISQMFGEIVGAWTAQVWSGMGRPAPVIVAELGPGRGTLMKDALRVAGRVPGFVAAVRPWLVETSPVLRRIQARTLRGALTGGGPFWAERVEMVAPGPMILLANEFFDALPIRQFQRTDILWRERQVTLSEDGALAFGWGPPLADPGLDARFPQVADGAVVEVSPAGEAIAARLGQRLERTNGAALVIDYGGWDGTGDTLQALRHHAAADPLAEPGLADLTAHVRFRALAEAAATARAWGPVDQGAFLERLGITARANALAAAGPEAAASVAAAHRRLTHPDEMGHLFQVMALAPHAAPAPPGLEG